VAGLVAIGPEAAVAVPLLTDIAEGKLGSPQDVREAARQAVQELATPR